MCELRGAIYAERANCHIRLDTRTDRKISINHILPQNRDNGSLLHTESDELDERSITKMGGKRY